MVIGIMGTPIESSNLGCMALTYSLLIELEKISKQMNTEFKYIIFDGSDNETARLEICNALNIKEDHLISGHMSLLYNPLRIMKNISKTIKMILEIKLCDCIIDITGGDSFSDIYGEVIFYGRTYTKILVEKMNKPLLLAPQTYGPFQTKKTKQLASYAIANADCVLTRDMFSYNVIKKLTDKNVICCADMAFLLPYNKKEYENTNQIKVGINVSKLLYSDDLEVSARNFSTTVDYQKYIDGLLRYLTSSSKYEVYMIPHVGLDHEVHQELKKKYPTIKLVQPTTNPIMIKSLISEMDIFIGARMHGAIAAFTTGVACIPTAYSRKFSGLFKSIGYDVLIDLQKIETDKAIQDTISYVKNYKKLKERVIICNQNIEMKLKSMEKAIGSWINDIVTNTKK